MDSFEKLKQIKKMMDEGIITEEEYQSLKAKLLDEFDNKDVKAAPQATEKQNTVPAPAQSAQADPVTVQPGVISQEGATTGMKVLSFLIPLVGLILFIVNQNTKPVEAKDELKWAAIGFGVGLLSYILLVGCTAASYY